MSRSSVRIIVFALFALPLLGACGTKGALYKPASAQDAQPPKMIRVTPVKTSSSAPTVDADGH
ncbi:MAG: lipoprotein [Dokdonella sp.]